MYVTCAPEIVSEVEPAPVLKAVLSSTVAVRVVLNWERWSFTVTLPSEPDAVPPGAADERAALSGALMVSPVVAVTVNVVVVSAAVAGGDVATTAPSAALKAIATLRTRVLTPRIDH
ncbi:hypothetical protein [Streptomyces ossamyceticus]|uniref:hypothetical protein n=1 Tax=Streptomyces ossamyceticus TaxID=249581 RepID=UPI0034179041